MSQVVILQPLVWQVISTNLPAYRQPPCATHDPGKGGGMYGRRAHFSKNPPCTMSDPNKGTGYKDV